jgi:hypothetical protein
MIKFLFFFALVSVYFLYLGQATVNTVVEKYNLSADTYYVIVFLMFAFFTLIIHTNRVKLSDET